MAEWWEYYDPSVGSYDTSTEYYNPSVDLDAYLSDLNFDDFYADDYSGGFDWSFPEFQTPSFDFPTFDPGQYDYGFDPNFGSFAEPEVGDPFALRTGDLSLPTYPLTSALGTEGSYEGGYSGFGSSAAPVDLAALFQQLGSGQEVTQQNFPLMASLDNSGIMSDAGPNLLSASNVGQPGFNFASTRNLDTGWAEPGFSLFDRGASTLGGGGDFGLGGNLQLKDPITGGPVLEDYRGGKGTSGNERYEDARARYYELAPLLGLGQLGMSLGGGLLGAFGPGPKPRPLSDIERAKVQAEIDTMKAKIDLEREALRMRGEEMGAETPEDPRMAIAELQAAIAREQNEIERENARLQANTAIEVANINERQPLFQTDPRFSALYDETTAAQSGLSPNAPEVQEMTQQIYAVRSQALEGEFAKQRDAILERSNRLGTNPAAELAQINEAAQQQKSALMVEAQQAALAFAQSRLDPSQKLLQAILGTVV